MSADARAGFPGWLRRNLWALIAFAVLATASVGYAFAFDWQRYQDRNPTQPVLVPRGESADYGGIAFALEEFTLLEGDSADGRRYGVAEGTDVVIAVVRITPDPEGDPEGYVSCEFRLRAPSPEGEREWWPESGNPTTLPEPETEGYGCLAGGPDYVLRSYYVVPAGGAEGSNLQVTVPGELPRALRLL